MSRKYTHLKQYEEEILRMKEKGCTKNQIAEEWEEIQVGSSIRLGD